MRYNELFIKLTYLTKINNIKQLEIGIPINKNKAAMNKRAKFNTDFENEEIKLIEKHFGISLSDATISDNFKKRQFDENLKSKLENIGKKITSIQEKNDLTDSQMASLLNISDKEYSEIKTIKTIPEPQILFNLLQNFNFSLDWLILDK